MAFYGIANNRATSVENYLHSECIQPRYINTFIKENPTKLSSFYIIISKSDSQVPFMRTQEKMNRSVIGFV